MNDQHHDSDDPLLNRRSVLRGVAGATSALALGTAATGSALASDVTDDLAALPQRYDTPGAVRSAVLRHAGDLLGTLARNGLLDAGDASALPLATRIDRREFTGRDPGVSVTGVVEQGEPTARIAVGMPMDDGVLHLNVLPEIDRSYAALIPDDDAAAPRTFDSSGDGGVGELNVGPNSIMSICRYEDAACYPATLYCYPNDCYIYPDSGWDCTECFLDPCFMYCNY